MDGCMNPASNATAAAPAGTSAATTAAAIGCATPSILQKICNVETAPEGSPELAAPAAPAAPVTAAD